MRVRILSELTEVDNRFEYARVLKVPEGAQSLTITLLQRKFGASHTLLGLRVEQIEKTALYKFSVSALGILFMMSALMKMRANLRKVNIIPLLLIAGCALMIVAGVLMTGDGLKGLRWMSRQITPQFFSKILPIDYIPLQDILHFLGFMVLAVVVLVLRNNARQSIFSILFNIALFALFTEILQMHSLERTPSILDIVIDVAGIVVGACLWYCFYMYRLNKKVVCNEPA